MQRFLIIQTSFLGDVVLATALVEKLRAAFPESGIDFLLRKGNEELLANNPQISKTYVWDKKRGKLKNLWRIAREVRRERYTAVINPHRGATTGFVTLMSGAAERRGFAKNPFAWCYTHKYAHRFSAPGDAQVLLETERNQQLIATLTDETPARPRLYPSAADEAFVKQYKGRSYVCIAPSSIWATKRFPPERFAALIAVLPENMTVYILGGQDADELAKTMIAGSGREGVVNLSGALTMLQSVALMQGAVMNYSNDSAPMHFASAVNAPMTGVYCSTHRCYGFGPLSDHSKIVEVDDLYCKPCGLHGYPACPQGHFRCAKDIDINQLLWWTTPQI